MNIWDKYPTKGTHFEAMQDKVKQHTWTYYTYYGCLLYTSDAADD